MRVICIQTEHFICGNNAGGTSITKGSVYHVTAKKTREEAYELRKHRLPSWFSSANLGLGMWYELLELEGFHHESKFLEIPEDNIEQEIETLNLKIEQL